MTSPPIRTPDQRLRVFVSSTLRELAPERAAVRDAIAHLHLVPVLFELGARPHPPRDLYRAYLDQSQVFIGIYWERYGWTAPDMTISGLEDEWRLAGARPKLVYIKEPAPDRDAELERLLDAIRDDGSVSYRSFETPAELASLVEDDLALMLTETFEAAIGGGVGGPDPRLVPLPAPPSPLVGRDIEVTEITGLLLDGARLVTITGPGGCGKTRLALHIGESASDEDGRRVTFVDLTGIRDDALVMPTVASCLGVRDPGERTLVDAVARVVDGVPVLVVIDNFEHVVGAAPELAALLEATVGMQLLVTSREALRLRWEQEYPLQPLATPAADDHLGVTGIAGTPAVELFVQLARRVRPSFELTADNADAVAEVCRRLDGLPLALELAAARLRVLSVGDLLGRLGQRLDALGSAGADAPARHRTLREAMTWSYELLDPPERAVFRRAAVFAGGFGLDAAEVVLGGDGVPQGALLDVIDSLVDKSLLVSRTDDACAGITRFGLLETSREYGLELLAAAHELRDAKDRHLRWCADLVDESVRHFMTPEMEDWLDVVQREHDNVRAALDHAVSIGDAPRALSIAGGLWPFWDIRGHLREGQSHLRDALAMPAPPSLARGRALDALGWLTALSGDFDGARQLLREGLELVRAHGQPLDVAWSCGEQAMVAFNQLLADDAEALFAECRDLAALAGAEFLRGWGVYGLAHVDLLRGDLDGAIAGIEEALALGRMMDVPWGEAWARFSLAVVRVLRGESALGITQLAQSMQLRVAIGDGRGVADCLTMVATLATDARDPAWAARLHGAAEVQRDANGLTVLPFMRPLFDQSLAALEAALGPDGLAAQWAIGRTMPVEKATAEALAFAD